MVYVCILLGGVVLLTAYCLLLLVGRVGDSSMNDAMERIPVRSGPVRSGRGRQAQAEGSGASTASTLASEPLLGVLGAM